MAHRNARLIPAGCELLVRRILADGWPVPVAAASVGVSRATADQWLHRYRIEGPSGLLDRPSRPRTSPQALPVGVTATVLTE
jgi:transposase